MLPGKIIYLTHAEIDKKKWDDCISNSINGYVYAYSWYLDIVCPDWDALIEDNYESVFPLTQNKKYGIGYLYPPFFTQQSGLFSKNKITREKLNLFLMCIPEKFRFIEINLNTENNFTTHGFQQKKNLTHHLDLNFTYETICRNYSENLKRNLKKAVKIDQQVVKNADAKKTVNLFRENRGKDINNLKDLHYNMLLKIMETAGKKNLLSIYGAEKLNPRHSTLSQLVAGAFFLKSKGKAIFLFSGSNAEARKNFSMPLIIDAFIKDNAEKNIVLDFEGSNDLNLARFYKSFGAAEIVYLQIKKNNLPLPLKWIKK